MKFKSLPPEIQALNPELSDEVIRLEKKNSIDQVDKKVLFRLAWAQYAPLDLPSPVEEYRFNKPKSRHRFDFAFPNPSRKLAIEIDGGNWIVRNGRAVGRHTGDSDMLKMNLASSLGWRVMHFSPKMLRDDPQKCIEMVVQACRYANDSGI